MHLTYQMTEDQFVRAGLLVMKPALTSVQPPQVAGSFGPCTAATDAEQADLRSLFAAHLTRK